MHPIVEVVPRKPATPTDRAQKLELLVHLEAPEQPLPTRPPLNLALVIDRSGSMGGEKMAKAREAAAFAVQQLGSRDRISLVIYDDQVEVLWPSSPLQDKTRLLQLIQQIHSRGSTNLFGGWVEGSTQVAAHLQPESLNRVILFTDGLANRGLTNAEEIGQHVAALAQRGVSTSTLGIGRDFNEDLLALMADRGEGNFYFIEAASDLPRIFARELSGLAATFARNLTLQLEAPGCQLEVLNAFTQEKDRYRLPDLIDGLPLELGISALVPADTPLNLTLRFDWLDANGQPHTHQQTLALPQVSHQKYLTLPEEPRVLAYLARLEATQAREQAVALIDQGDLTSARQYLLNTVAALSSAPAEVAQHLRLEISELEALQGRVFGDTWASRKLLQEQRLRNRKGKRE
jgi:Ca-activated chloride channel family protein